MSEEAPIDKRRETLRQVNEYLIGHQFGQRHADPHPVWETIYRERCRRKLGISRLAAMAGVSSSTVSRGERGYGMAMSAVLKILNALELDLVAVPRETTDE